SLTATTTTETHTLSLHDALPISWYHQTTRDALVRVSENEGPFLQRHELQNVGKIRNRGIELQVDAHLLDGADWALDLGLGLSTKDRKSTRLNSSHVKISYAVFCL